MRKYTSKIITSLVIIIVLTTAFWVGGNAPNLRGFEVNAPRISSQGQTYIEKTDPSQTDVPPDVETAITDEEADIPQNSTVFEPQNSAVEEYLTEDSTTADYAGLAPSPDTSVPPDGSATDPTDEELLCTITVTCKTLLNNLTYLSDGKAAIVPEDGIILSEKTVRFNQGETAFNVLQRELKREKIHLEFTSTPIYNSSYIEGISNIYEFDCGEGSGWMYKVNDTFPTYGSSRYIIKSGDKIEYIYSCDLGKDIGGEYASDGQKQ